MMNWAAKTSPTAFLGSHDIDLFMWMFNSDIKQVYANGVKKVLVSRGIDAYDAIQVNAVFENGCIGVFENSWIVPNSYPIIADGRKQIYTESGFINLEMGTDQMSVYDNDGALVPSFYLQYPDNGKVAGAFKQAHDHFIDCILNDMEAGPGIESSAKVTMVLEAVKLSLLSGKPVELPLS